MFKAVKTILIILLLTILSGFKAYSAQKGSIESQLRGTSDITALKTEILVSKSEKKAIKLLKKLIRKYKNTPLEPDMQMRLAELYVRRSKTVLFFELNKDSRKVISFMPRTLKNQSSKKFLKKAIRVYSYIESKFPTYENIDLVIFNNGMAYQQIGQGRNAEKKYWKLVKNYSYSPLVPDAHLAIGEINYKAKSFKNALSHFQAIRKYPDSRVYPYGLYKAAWTYYNLRKTDLGLKQLEDVVKYGRYVVKNNIDARLDLRKEALGDMSLFFEDVHSANRGYEYFKKWAGELDASVYIMKLSHLYKIHSKYKSREIILKDFIENETSSSLLPTAHRYRVENYEDMKNRPQVVSHLKAYDEFCFKSDWSRVSAKDKKRFTEIRDCKKDLNKLSLNLSSKWIRLWKKNPTHPVFAHSAEGAFSVYLSHNTKGSVATKARYIYADLLFQLKKYSLASSQYSLVGSYVLGTKSSKGQMAHDSRYAAIVSLQKSVKDKWNDTDEKSLVKLSNNYISNHKRGKHRLDVEFKLGLIAYEKARYKEAKLKFIVLGESYKDHKKGIKAQDIYLDILNIQKDYAQLKTYVYKLIKREKSKGRKIKLNHLYEQSYFLLVQKTEEKGKLKKAASDYKKFAIQNPKSELAEKAWWNAIQIHYKMQDFLVGAKAAESYYRLFPAAPHVKEALVKAAQSYEAIGNTQRAAVILESLSKKDKKESVKWLTLAADFYFLSGKTKKAKALYFKLLNSPNKKIQHQALKSLEILESSKPLSKAHQRILNIIIKNKFQPDASLAQLKYVENYAKTNQLPKAFVEAKKILSMGSKASTYAKARARFIQAEILQGEFENQSLKTSLDRLSLVLNLKTGKLDKAQRAYESAIRYGDPGVSVKAMTRLTSIYKNFYKSLLNMPTPRGLESKDEPTFRQEIEKIAYPVEERSVETLSEALSLAKKYQLHDGSVTELQNKLNEANMVKSLPSLVKVGHLPPVLAIEYGGAL